MATISASQVKALREKTGISMGDCKKALVEAAGDEARAIEILTEKYKGKIDKRADKEATNGRIGAFTNGKGGALIELRCETDFVAKNEDFKTAADNLARIVVESGKTKPEDIKATKGPDGKTGADLITAVFGKLQENMVLERAVFIPNGVASYVHHNGLVGSVLAADNDGDGVGKHICMHIAATAINGFDRNSIAKSEADEARKGMMEEAKGKPPEIADKIVSGKMDKWYGERVLMEQAFAMDDKKTIQQVADEAGMKVSGYLKMELGVKG